MIMICGHKKMEEAKLKAMTVKMIDKIFVDAFSSQPCVTSRLTGVVGHTTRREILNGNVTLVVPPRTVLDQQKIIQLELTWVSHIIIGQFFSILEDCDWSGVSIPQICFLLA